MSVGGGVRICIIYGEYLGVWKEAKPPCVGRAKRVRSCARPCLSIYSQVSCTVLHSSQEVQSANGGVEGGCERVVSVFDRRREEA
jgi:hypothetical protein